MIGCLHSQSMKASTDRGIKPPSSLNLVHGGGKHRDKERRLWGSLKMSWTVSRISADTGAAAQALYSLSTLQDDDDNKRLAATARIYGVSRVRPYPRAVTTSLAS